MRGFLAVLATTGALFGALSAPAGAQSTGAAQRSLQRALHGAMQEAGRYSGAYVVDMNTGRALFSQAATRPRLPASVEKVYTTSTALVRLGANTRLATGVFGSGTVSGGTWHGTLYLRGGGDPTFGSRSYDHYAYNSGATVQQLVANLIAATGIHAIQGRIVGDESYFDSLRGTPPYGDNASTDIEGELSALAYDRGLANEQGTAFQSRPALFAAEQFAAALRAAGVKVPNGIPIYTGTTPSSAQQLGLVHSPKISWLIHLTNSPSDNFFAEMLLKGIGAKFGGAGSTAAGAAVVRSQLASFGIHPKLNDGSGLSRSDQTTPQQVVTVLEKMATNRAFTSSLAIGGETGTLVDEMRGTAAQRNCIGKTGTLHDVASLAGYCTARDGHKLVFAFLFNRLGNPDAGHLIEANMAATVAKYDG
ncbi:MAG TPA: D-alanyl-D-alanine carboxypeptidase/D-alanyl-D-alanine-endopeptidase [Solirubrobacteraceae bacterium]|jgi:D-alanyl-D-alanine carboxypeptidase/D-alanyl-D-alanine-endopeptidase (penicillin-binding protein 4)